MNFLGHVLGKGSGVCNRLSYKPLLDRNDLHGAKFQAVSPNDMPRNVRLCLEERALLQFEVQLLLLRMSITYYT
jgi:hypothetical protein